MVFGCAVSQVTSQVAQGMYYKTARGRVLLILHSLLVMSHSVMLCHVPLIEPEANFRSDGL